MPRTTGVILPRTLLFFFSVFVHAYNIWKTTCRRIFIFWCQHVPSNWCLVRCALYDLSRVGIRSRRKVVSPKNGFPVNVVSADASIWISSYRAVSEWQSRQSWLKKMYYAQRKVFWKYILCDKRQTIGQRIICVFFCETPWGAELCLILSTVLHPIPYT